MKTILVLISLFSVNAFAKDILQIKAEFDACNYEAATTKAQIECGQVAWSESDVELNVVYKAINKSFNTKIKADKLAKDTLLEAERAWIKYRDTNCVAHKASTGGGSLGNVLLYKCYADMTIERTLELQNIYGGF